MDEALKQKLSVGLSAAQVKEKTAAGQVNGDLDVKTRSYKEIIFGNLFTLFNGVNLVLLICILSVGSLRNALFFFTVILNFGIGVFQEVRAKKTIDKLSLLTAPKAHVLRDSKITEIQVKDILLGDIMEIKAGGQVCADCVILDGECQVNESLITGETTPIIKKKGGHLLSGSYIVAGRVMCEVEHIGTDNYVNQITVGAKYVKKQNSIIMDSIKRVVLVVTIALAFMAIFSVWKNFFAIEQSFEDAMISTVASISAMIPGGLLILTSGVMMVSVIRLAGHHALAQDLYSVEFLARVDTICLDKTGTITEGSMEVSDVVPFAGYDEKELKTFAAEIADENSTIEAIRNYLNVDMKQYAAGEKKSVQTIPFSSSRKYSLVYEPGKGSLILGAVEMICPERFDAMKGTIEGYAANAKRVVGFAKSGNAPDGFNLPKDITLCGLIVIGDKVRANAKETLKFFEEEKVDLKVISGDNPLTVSVVAKEAGFKGAEKYVDAVELKSYEDIEKAVDEYTIFGRVTPYQKLDIIKALQAHGHKVAMVGDGANDVLALKQADCSIAMQSGSEAARNVSNLVLLDSNFATMPYIVAEGRKSINNLQRSAGLYLTKTTYAFLLAFIFFFATFTYPFQSIQLTLIGAVTIGMPSFFLALEPNKEPIHLHFLRSVFLTALPSGIMTAASIIFVTVFSENVLGASGYQAETIACFTTMITGLIIIIDICGKMTPWKIGLVLWCIAFAVFFILVFPNLFTFVSLTFRMWMLIIGTSLVFLAIHLPLFRLAFPKLDKKLDSLPAIGKGK